MSVAVVVEMLPVLEVLAVFVVLLAEVMSELRLRVVKPDAVLDECVVTLVDLVSDDVDPAEEDWELVVELVVIAPVVTEVVWMLVPDVDEDGGFGEEVELPAINDRLVEVPTVLERPMTTVVVTPVSEIWMLELGKLVDGKFVDVSSGLDAEFERVVADIVVKGLDCGLVV